MMWCDINVFVVRQLLLEIAICLISFTTGIALTFPSILNPAIFAPDSTIKVTPLQASWIVSYLGLGGLVGYAFMSAVFEIFGRKKANIVINLFLLIGNLMLYIANDVYSLAFARLTQGLSIGGTFITVLGLCECISPKRRGYFMVLNKVSLGSGSLACHGLGLFLNWRQIALLGSLGNLISIIIFTLSAESPSYFAIRGQIDKCASSFEWYRGVSLNSKKELKELILAQTENLRIKERDKDISVFRKTVNMIRTKEFQKSFFIVTLASLCLDTCGRYFLLIYITQILMELLNGLTSAMYVSVAFDCVTIFGLCISSVLVRKFKRRTLLFKVGFVSVFLMFMVSFSIILQSKVHFFQELKWLTPALILLHTFTTNIGLVPISFSLAGEVFSLNQKALGSFISGVVFLIFFNFIMILTPIMIDNIGVEGTYCIYGLLLFVFLILLRLILPETKDKTLQQIEDEIKGIVRKNSENELLSKA